MKIADKNAKNAAQDSAKSTDTNAQNLGQLLILSGPSGCGKSTLTSALLEQIPNIYFSISTTTRAPRAGEKEGVHYHFTDEKSFLEDVKNAKFLEWAEVHGNYYGTALAPIERALGAGKLVVFDVDVQGHRDIKAHFGARAKSIFITTKSKAVLKERLERRGSDKSEVIELRLMHAFNEMSHIDKFDYVIINDDIATARAAIVSIARSLAYLSDPVSFENLLSTWCD